MRDNAFMVVVAVIAAGLLISWAQRKWMPGMSFTTRLFVVGGGALVLGGMMYGAIWDG